jgi:hypothetical protein
VTVNLHGRCIVALEICSYVLEEHLWVALDSKFSPANDDGLAVFYADEIPLLLRKTFHELKWIHQVKATFGAGSKLQR